ncbi:NAD(P)H-dependent flavin oxidoreductase [Rhodococcoides fascians]|uniref:NAD(P)H-dependent flavin oxidoreductase n=1 Tax=Rhodococcoides fascians TaxID=1828 RepID=UPI00195617C6|nr:nitronate monooxygenase family protein [Rhodococcus fascians]MBM7242540.1 nitronate monooxygenase [Rhodococcus fascians]
MNHATISTAITSMLGIDLPIVQAGMSWVSSCAELPAAVSNAGGLGVLAAGPMRIPDFRATLSTLRSSTRKPFAVNLPLYRAGADELAEILLDDPVPVVIASQGGPKRHLSRFHEVGTRWLHVVSTVPYAVKAAEAGVDGLIVVGGEAGGHPPTDLVSTMVAIRAVRKRLPDMPIVASGGFADGAGLAAALALGADAAQFGTRFIASNEASVSPAYQDRVVGASVSDTRTVGRDLGLIRMLSNEFSDSMLALEQSGALEDERKELFLSSSLKDAAFHGSVDKGKVEAGQSAGLIDSVLPADEIVSSIVAEYFDAVSRLPGC